MTRIGVVAVAALVLAGCSDAGNRNRASPTTRKPATSYRFTDCSKIRAGDKLGNDALAGTCDPANRARKDTLDCVDGTYVLLHRRQGNLEGIVGRTNWQEAGEVDATTGRTQFAFNQCQEHE